MVDGAAVLSAMTYTFLGNGQWRDERGVNLLDSGAHFYDTYETSDGKWISLGSIEPQFYALLLEKTGLTGDADFAQQLKERGYLAMSGQIVDATLVAAPKQRNTQSENDAIKEGKTAAPDLAG